ncbi:MAG: 50S ribosomal protein L11 methyltransferase [Cyanobacteria bacterium]|nr:50S ribosomal protein L11 methyltransferase [Cyanobacteriota bacterium]
MSRMSNQVTPSASRMAAYYTLPTSVIESSNAVDFICEYLWGLEGIESVETILDGEIGSEKPQGLIVIFDPEKTQPEDWLTPWPDAWSAHSELSKNKPLLGCVKTIMPEDWESSWKQFWHQTAVSETLWICPSWETPADISPGACVITLDPGNAFGTGAHETTRLMLQSMENLSSELTASGFNWSDKQVLDVGTGSGILAIYAALRGCRSVRAIDNDSVAVRVCRENAALNHVDSYITVDDLPLYDLCLTRYDLIVANILAEVILELLPEMLLRLEPGGTVLFSGLIEKTYPAVEQAMTKAGLEQIHKKQLGDWFLLHGKSPY